MCDVASRLGVGDRHSGSEMALGTIREANDREPHDLVIQGIYLA